MRYLTTACGTLIWLTTVAGFPSIAAAQNAQKWPENPAEAMPRPQQSGPNDRPAITPNVQITHGDTSPAYMTCPEYRGLPSGGAGETGRNLAPPDITYAPFSKASTYDLYVCSCNQQLYTDISLCNEACSKKVGLSCFVGICNPQTRTKPLICVKATAPVRFTLASIPITIHDWHLYEQDQAVPACRAAANNFANFIVEHELHHATDIIANFGRWNQLHANDTVGPVEACADTLDAAEKDAAGQIGALLDPYWQDLQQTIYNTGHGYHYFGDAIGFMPALDCSACPSGSQ